MKRRRSNVEGRRRRGPRVGELVVAVQHVLVEKVERVVAPHSRHHLRHAYWNWLLLVWEVAKGHAAFPERARELDLFADHLERLLEERVGLELLLIG